MAFDAHMEDFQRLGLRHMGSLDATDPFGAARSIARFGQKYAQNRDALPQNDQDRAFSLVCRATDLIDYQLPFSTEETAQKLIAEARRLLEEAMELDGDCHDARRMLAAADNPSFEDYYRFLVQDNDKVREACEQAASEFGPDTDPQAQLGRDLAMRPYYRWLAAISARALECGHYRASVEAGLALLDYNSFDPADVRYTLALAYAKLEDGKGLAALMERDIAAQRESHDVAWLRNPWYAIASLALAFKRRDYVRARSILEALLRSYPHAGITLAQQNWLPDGAFARIVVHERSEDELILATSEATVIFQEGCDSRERGTLGTWVATQPEIVELAQKDRKELGAMGEEDER